MIAKCPHGKSLEFHCEACAKECTHEFTERGVCEDCGTDIARELAEGWDYPDSEPLGSTDSGGEKHGPG